ncbi:phage virion morphogenesis protein [gamma proteobacterium HTCC5015]|nr:phage virion morphogenesis protein [gamma proteobacterium HTCC5015]
MEDDFEKLANWLGPLIKSLEPKAQRQLSLSLARTMRDQNKDRIKRQVSPDGQSFEPKKRGPNGRLRRRNGIRSKIMFKKLRTAKYMKAEATAEGAVVRFAGRAARIANVHHHGLRERLGKNRTIYDFPERELLGFAKSDIAALERLILSHLDKL